MELKQVARTRTLSEKLHLWFVSERSQELLATPLQSITISGGMGMQCVEMNGETWGLGQWADSPPIPALSETGGL